eukprot:gnl/MRDRNA2_/MRDRNA2_94985_c0_seq1.p1 gnl/MRDRNA2_/MRDRNA2_94985_c0~~gnl/MRDRNA2_/MRDRNA2_94985_c0_seq1.p1  ORF type:complete len:257 (+),score=51.90 gnl/MRDRNA2_/MRDRNA2_94985_c0_seq1:95-865(+)
MTFALEEYTCPKFGFGKTVPGGTMPKDSGEKQSRLGQIKKHSANVPGPGHYDMGVMDQKKWARVLMGTFSKMPRDSLFHRNKTPPVGYYAANPDVVKPRLKNGKVSQSPRVCAIVDTAERRGRASPTLGLYKPNDPTYRVPTPSFAHGGKRASSVPPGKGNKNGAPGPGSYEIKYTQVDQESPWTEGKKADAKETFNREPKKTFIDKIQKDKAKVPAPGHVGNPDAAKVHNKVSPRLHGLRLLQDRPISAQDFSSI